MIFLLFRNYWMNMYQESWKIIVLININKSKQAKQTFANIFSSFKLEHSFSQGLIYFQYIKILWLIQS